MKVRSGFVSNSSSSSFVLIADDNVYKYSDSYGKTYLRGREGQQQEYPVLEYLYIDVPSKLDFCRSMIARYDSIEDKAKYLIAMYAVVYQEDPNYFFIMDRLVHKLYSLGEKYGYSFQISTPPIFGSVYTRRYNAETMNIEDCDPYVKTFVRIYTESSYLRKLADMVEAEDTSELESYLFNPHSFCILGGDEYKETFELQYQARKEVNYPYHRYADSEDIEKGTLESNLDFEFRWGEYDPAIYFDDENGDWDYAKITEDKRSSK